MHTWLYQIGNAQAVFKRIWVTLRTFLEPFKENLNYQNYFENYSKELQKKKTIQSIYYKQSNNDAMMLTLEKFLSLTPERDPTQSDIDLDSQNMVFRA